MNTPINNLKDLRLEINRLQKKKNQQEAVLKEQLALLQYKVEAPLRVGRMLSSFIPGSSAIGSLFSFVGKAPAAGSSDWLTKGLQLIMPVFLNKTMLKKSGWLKKFLVMFASETAVSKVNRKTVTGWIDQLTALIKPKKHKAKVSSSEVQASPEAALESITAEEAVQDNSYGIPKDSEAY